VSDVVAAVAVVMAVGLLGTLVPLVPGLPLIWVGALVFGLSEGWGVVGWVAMGLITLLLIAGLAGKIVVPHRRVMGRGVPRSSMAVGALTGLIGFFVVPVVGLPLGAAAGLTLAERRRSGDWSSAWDSARSAIIGFGLGTLLELAAGMAMIAVWLGWVVVRG
jgi:uncharacterized protein YqgC (DUF456 family)